MAMLYPSLKPAPAPRTKVPALPSPSSIMECECKDCREVIPPPAEFTAITMQPQERVKERVLENREQCYEEGSCCGVTTKSKRKKRRGQADEDTRGSYFNDYYDEAAGDCSGYVIVFIIVAAIVCFIILFVMSHSDSYQMEQLKDTVKSLKEEMINIKIKIE